MPWKGVTVSEERQEFLKDYRLGYYTVSELAGRYSVSRKTAHKWIQRLQRRGEDGFHELSRRPQHCPGRTAGAIVEELVALRRAHPCWGRGKLLDLMGRRHPRLDLPSVATVRRILAREGLLRARRRWRRAHPGCPKTMAQGPNDIWAADSKGLFRLKNGQYCFPLTVSDPGEPVSAGVRRPSGDLAGADAEALPAAV
jgi:transposase-like protein